MRACGCVLVCLGLAVCWGGWWFSCRLFVVSRSGACVSESLVQSDGFLTAMRVVIS